MKNGSPSLDERFRHNLRRLGVEPGSRLLVAVSGGCDSITLLHLLRFAAGELSLSLTAAHLDHAMRAGSAADARWLAGVCAAWRVPLVAERHPGGLRGEDHARRARYAFLARAAGEARADRIVTAHHADDQAETVLFRILRGTGLAGLAGIPEVGASGLLRPLLPFWRREIERYARRAGLRWRDDPTNLSLGPARNRIRHVLLPEMERSVAPRARRSLVALAGAAREAEEALDRATGPVERELIRSDEGAYLLARTRLRGYDSAIGSRVVRNLLRQFGVVPSRSGTRTALQFITDAPSGRELQLPGGVRIRTEFDQARVERAREVPPDLPLELGEPGPRPEEGRARIGGREYRVRWMRAEHAAQEPAGERWEVAVPLAGRRLPLLLRGWRPGDRLRTDAGTKPLKKLFGERRVPRSRRASLPVLADADGTVLWVAGVARSAAARPEAGDEILILTVVDDRFRTDPGPDRGTRAPSDRLSPR